MTWPVHGQYMYVVGLKLQRYYIELLVEKALKLYTLIEDMFPWDSVA